MSRMWMRVGLLALAAIFAVRARAAFTDNFDALKTELASRSAALAESVDKTEQKQKKACDKAIATIDKSTSLSGDVKTAGKVAKSLAKAFPSEFGVSTFALITFTNNLSTLVSGVFSGLVEEVQVELDDLQTTIDGLPAGTAKDKAQELHDTAQQLLDDSNGSVDFALAAKALAGALKDVLKGVKATTSGNGGGGGGGGHGLNCKINGTPHNALGATGVYVGSTGELAITGPTLQKTVTVIAEGVTTPGTYPAAGGTGVQEISGGSGTYTGNLTGTVYVSKLDLNHMAASGTFSFTATQTLPTVTSNEVNVTEGSFNCTISVLP